jgi:hypothetical protein
MPEMPHGTVNWHNFANVISKGSLMSKESVQKWQFLDSPLNGWWSNLSKSDNTWIGSFNGWWSNLSKSVSISGWLLQWMMVQSVQKWQYLYWLLKWMMVQSVQKRQYLYWLLKWMMVQSFQKGVNIWMAP